MKTSVCVSLCLSITLVHFTRIAIKYRRKCSSKSEVAELSSIVFCLTLMREILCSTSTV